MLALRLSSCTEQLAQLGEGVAYDLETGPSPIAAAPAPTPSTKKLKKVDGVACGQKWRELIESEGRYITRLKTMRDVSLAQNATRFG